MRRELKWKPKFIAHLAKTCNVSRAARLAKVGRKTAYEHRERDPKFAAEWDEALEIAVDALEYEMRRRAIEGCVEPVFYKGDECGSIRRYSDLLAIFLAKAHRPEKYRDNFRQDQKTTGNLADLVAEAEARAELRKLERQGL
jgi:hypothetical protein